MPFSVDAAVGYLAGLQEPTRTSPLDYKHKAPVDVVTPVRKKVAAVLDPSAIPTGAAALNAGGEPPCNAQKDTLFLFAHLGSGDDSFRAWTH